jgi:hypothetical protein
MTGTAAPANRRRCSFIGIEVAGHGKEIARSMRQPCDKHVTLKETGNAKRFLQCNAIVFKFAVPYCLENVTGKLFGSFTKPSLSRHFHAL